MAASGMSLKVIGGEKLLAKLKSGFAAGPVRTALQRSAIAVESESKRQITAMRAVDTGRLRASITHRLDAAAIPRFAAVGTNVEYGIFVHEGTRKRGAAATLKARPFLAKALEQMASTIQAEFQRAAREIEGQWRAR